MAADVQRGTGIESNCIRVRTGLTAEHASYYSSALGDIAAHEVLQGTSTDAELFRLDLVALDVSPV